MRVVLIAAVLCSACGGGGALRQARVVDKTDQRGSELDAPLAVGATYRPEVKLELKGGGTPALFLQSARENVVRVGGDELTAVQPGLTAILVHTREQSVIDFFHVWVESPTHITLHRQTEDAKDLGEVTAPLGLMVGESLRLAPRIHAGAQRLAGSAQASWRVEPPLLELLHDGIPERRRLVGRAAGDAKVTVTMVGKSATIAVKVVPS